MPMGHQPAPPRNAQPPGELRRLSEGLRHPDVSGVGLTTTADGTWALIVHVRSGKQGPVPEIDQQAAPHPVVYDTIERMPVARPAFPDEGE